MATQLIATAATAADSADIVVAAGTPVTVSLKGVVDGQARVLIKLKDDAGVYVAVSELTSHRPAQVLAGPGTFQLTRIAGATCGVFRD